MSLQQALLFAPSIFSASNQKFSSQAVQEKLPTHFFVFWRKLQHGEFFFEPISNNQEFIKNLRN